MLADDGALLRGRRVLELGSGTGILTIALRARGFDVTSSDYDDPVIAANIAHNCRLNALADGPHVAHTWGAPFAWPSGVRAYDVVLGSDLLLYAKSYAALVETLRQLLDRCRCCGDARGCAECTADGGDRATGPVALLNARRRVPGDGAFFALLAAAGARTALVQHRIVRIEWPRRRGAGCPERRPPSSPSSDGR